MALECLDDFRRAVASVSNRFMDGNLILFANAIELFQIRLVVVTAAGRHFSIENDPTVGINCLMHFVFELPGRPLLLGERRIWIGTTAVRLIG